MSFQTIAHQINTNLAAQSSMRVGAVVNHPDGYKVKVLSGQYLDSTYGRVSNWWTWARVLKGGTLGRKVSGYGW